MVRQAVLQVPGQEDRHAFRLPMWQTAAVEHIETVRTTGRTSPTAGETAGIADLAVHSTTDPQPPVSDLGDEYLEFDAFELHLGHRAGLIPHIP